MPHKHDNVNIQLTPSIGFNEDVTSQAVTDLDNKTSDNQNTYTEHANNAHCDRKPLKATDGSIWASHF